MQRPALAVLLVALLAGCLGSTVPPMPVAQAAPDRQALLACPVREGEVVPCEPEGDNPLFLETEPDPPVTWTCLSFMDQRFEHDEFRYPFPDWYTFFGPALGGDRTRPGSFEIGFLYDNHNDTERVLGTAIVISEDETLRYTWEGPSRAFVRIPVAITQPEVWVEGVITPPPGPTVGLHNDPMLPDPRNDVAYAPGGGPGLDLWSRGPWNRSDEVPNQSFFGQDWQWLHVRGVEAEGARYHLLGDNNRSMGRGSPGDHAGAQHWGQLRAGAWNASAPGLAESAITPYMEFYFHAENIFNPGLQAALNFLCECPDKPLASYEGVFCLLGRAPPIAPGGVVQAVRVPG